MTEPSSEPILHAINEAITAQDCDVSRLGLLNGLAGELLFQLVLHGARPDMVDTDLFSTRLEYLQDNLPGLGASYALSRGLTGVAWFLEYANQSQEADYDADLCTDIDALLLETVSPDHWAGEIEMVTGLGGIAVYAARRLRQTDQSHLFARIVHHYETLAEQASAEALTWPQPQGSVYRLDKDTPEAPEYNLGHAHGICGIIATLLPALAIPTLRARVHRLLEQSCAWLISQKFPAPTLCHFPTLSGSTIRSRLGWCYGDLPIALTLARVGKAIGRPDFVALARDTALLACDRDAETGSIWDAGLCHGSAGLGLMFLQLHHEIGAPELKEASERWYHHTLRLFAADHLRGFHKFDGYEQKYMESTGFLEGFAGIGLCLLARQTGRADWADCLLLS